jgi:hypothetical protein
LRLPLCEISGTQWQYHPLPKKEAIDRKTVARKGVVFGGTQDDRMYANFDSPTRWFPHKVSLKNLLPQFHKLYQEQLKKDKWKFERIHEIKGELGRGWFPWDIWTARNMADRNRFNFSDVSRVKVKLEEELIDLKSQIHSELWSDDITNTTNMTNLTNVRPLAFPIADAERLLSLPIPPQHAQNPNAAVGAGSGVDTLEELKRVGGWCILDVANPLGGNVEEDEMKGYQYLAHWLKKQDKVGRFAYPLIFFFSFQWIASLTRSRSWITSSS